MELVTSHEAQLENTDAKKMLEISILFFYWFFVSSHSEVTGSNILMMTGENKIQGWECYNENITQKMGIHLNIT